MTGQQLPLDVDVPRVPREGPSASRMMRRPVLLSDFTPPDSWQAKLARALDAAGVPPGGAFYVSAVPPRDEDPREPREGLARRDGPATSKTAAARVTPRSGTQRYVVIEAAVGAGDRGITRDELVAYHGLSYGAAPARCRELLDDGWLEVAEGRTRKTREDSDAEVLLATPKAAALVDGAAS